MNRTKRFRTSGGIYDENVYGAHCVPPANICFITICEDIEAVNDNTFTATGGADGVIFKSYPDGVEVVKYFESVTIIDNPTNDQLFRDIDPTAEVSAQVIFGQEL